MHDHLGAHNSAKAAAAAPMPEGCNAQKSSQKHEGYTHLHGSVLQPLKAHMLVQLCVTVTQPLPELLLQVALLWR